MSKLFDQLKDAAQQREGGILLDALARKQQSESAAGSSEPTPGPAQGELPLPVAAAARLRQESARAAQPPAAERERNGEAAPPESAPALFTRSSLAGLALAAAIFAVVVLAWHAAPWRAPQRLRIDPEGLKLDRSLDLERLSPKGTTSPPRPS